MSSHIENAVSSLRKFAGRLRGLLALFASLRRRCVAPRYAALLRLQGLYGSAGEVPPVLFFGDSVSLRTAKQDSDKRKLGEMLADSLAPGAFAWMAHSSYHAGVFRAMLGALAAMSEQPKLLVATINIRSFSPQWFLEPAWRFDAEIAALRAFAAKPKAGVPRLRELSAKAVSAKAREPYLAARVEYPFTDFKTAGEFVKLIESSPVDDEGKAFRKKQIFIYHYMHLLSPDHERLADLTGLCADAGRLGIKVLLYATPLNFEAGVRHVGPAFSSRLQENIDVLAAALKPFESERLVFRDWSRSLGSESFFDMNLATEHLNESGRLALAGGIKNEVEGILLK